MKKISNKISLGSYKTQGIKSSSSHKELDGPYYGLSSEKTPEEYRLYLSDGKWIDSRDPVLFYLDKAKQLLALSR